MTKYIFTNKLSWQNTFRNDVMNKGRKRAEAECRRRGYDFVWENGNEIEISKNGCGVCMGMVKLFMSDKGRVKDFELWIA